MDTIFNNLFIFEMANNHQGDVHHGIRIIKEMGKIAREYSVHAGVKFQYRDLDTFIHPAHQQSKENKHIPRFLSTRLKANDFLTLVQTARDEGLTTICTPFDEPSVGLILDHGIQIIKVASCSANDWPLLERISSARRPVIASTGGLNLKQIDNLVSFFTHREVNFAILHCVGIYPTPNKNVHAGFIQKLIQRYPGITAGYSGHEDPGNTDVIKIAIAKGARIFERHVGVETEDVRLNAYSLNPEQTRRWIASALEAFEICGTDNEKAVTQPEIDSLRSLMRGVFARVPVRAGDKLERDKVYFAMPIRDGQTGTFDYHETMVASRDYNPDEPISEQRIFRGKIDLIRSIIHDVKGMLHEAKIVVGQNFKIEISHHYGMEHFRSTGAVIIDIINRSYCKKLVIVLPGQNHPNHYHKIKEETFQLLWGDIELVINEATRVKLKPGDSYLVEPATPHSFSSVNGAILEEVSTTHIKGDSVYTDEKINKMDLLERKTLIENW